MSHTKPSLILFTGGGSAGHVIPSFPLIETFQRRGWKTHYVGSYEGIECELVKDKLPYTAISTGKFRRYRSWRNLLTPFQVLCGLWQAFWLCHRLKPAVVFSKGGFVAFPLVLGAWLNRIPVLAHESDRTPGLANRLSYPFCKTIFITWPDTQQYFKRQNKIVFSGTPIRSELFQGDPQKGRAFCQFTSTLPMIVVVGGSLGAERVNRLVKEALPTLLQHYQVALICGKGKLLFPVDQLPKHYQQFEYVSAEMPDLLAAADLVVSRAGANSIFELIALKKLHILLPLSTASRGDQIVNAAYCQQKGLSLVLDEQRLTATKFIQHIDELFHNEESYQKAMRDFPVPDAVPIILRKVDEAVH